MPASFAKPSRWRITVGRYLLFEGVHETGPIMLWDRGTWEPHLESDDIENALRKGSAIYATWRKAERWLDAHQNEQCDKCTPAYLDALQAS